MVTDRVVIGRLKKGQLLNYVGDNNKSYVVREGRKGGSILRGNSIGVLQKVVIVCEENDIRPLNLLYLVDFLLSRLIM